MKKNNAKGAEIEIHGQEAETKKKKRRSRSLVWEITRLCTHRFKTGITMTAKTRYSLIRPWRLRNSIDAWRFCSARTNNFMKEWRLPIDRR